MLFKSMLLIAVPISCSVHSAAEPIAWDAPDHGHWNEPQRWDLQRVPGLPGDAVTLGLVDAYSVRSSGEYVYSSLNISNSDAELVIEQGSHTMMLMMNRGKVIVGDTGSHLPSVLRISGFGSLSGDGVLELRSGSDLASAQIFGLLPLTQHEHHQIVGEGEIFAVSLENNGSVVATGPAGMRLNSIVGQSQTGKIGADSSTLLLPGSVVIEGGRLFTRNGGLIRLEGGTVRLHDLVLDAEVVHGRGDQVLVLQGDISNTGLIRLDASLADNITELHLDDETNVNGIGTIQLIRGPVRQAKLRLEMNNTATIGPDQIIETSSEIVLPDSVELVLDGQIRSLPYDQPLELSFEMAGEGAIIAAQNDVLLRGTTSLRGLTLGSEAKHAILIGVGAVSLRNVTNQGLFELRDDNETLNVFGVLTNNGVIRLTQSNGISRSTMSLYDGTSVEGNGVIELESFQGEQVRLEVQDGTTVIGPKQIVQGHGIVRATAGRKLIIRGVVQSADDSIPLYVQGDYDGEGVGKFVSQQAGIVFDASLANITIQANEGEEILFAGGVLSNVQISNPIRVLGNGGQAQQANFGIRGQFDVSQPILLERGSGLQMFLGSSLIGSSEILMEPGSYFGSEDFTGIRPIIESGVRIRGAGIFECQSVFAGSLTASIEDEPLIVSTRLVMKDGQLIAEHADIIFDDAVLIGGYLESRNGSVFCIDRAGFNATDIRLNGRLVHETDAEFEISSSLVNDGEIIVRARELTDDHVLLAFEDQCQVTGTGEFLLEILEGDGFREAQLVSRVGSITHFGSGQRVSGSGRLEGEFDIAGVIAPDGVHRAIQVREVILAPSSRVELDIGGVDLNEFDQVQVLPGGSVALAGTLSVQFDAGYFPEVGDSWVLVRRLADNIPGSLIGSFDAIQLPEPSENARYLVEQSDGQLTLNYRCTADMNGDHQINFFDVSEFVDLYGMKDPLADINSDGQHNFFDVSQFLISYQGGCQ